ncbi:tRNA wybutosine-synthesizing protein 3 [Nakaseomyces bracarensis]|uniref:tRNA(Phe) 7-[(3-amino-3-carboxypropyl)-4-demethylwyosine(37)-N(4)]-methyltransferase n=1 Tax=Nakaseomyces bracarensis TaxID=273131 RepID=A0ABR4NNK3_9SACH
MSKQNPFDQKKNAILQEINSIGPDLSPKGTIDRLCIPIIDLINKSPDMVTTSSCSGRISVFIEGTKAIDGDIKVGGKGEGGKWLFVSHELDEVDNWFQRVTEKEQITWEVDADSIEVYPDGSSRMILYKYEPFILHVKCRDFETASRLYNTAMSCGFRESGIGSNFIVAIRINIKLDVPIGYVDENKGTLKLICNPDYIKVLDIMTKAKFSENSKKMDQLYGKIESEMILKVNEVSKKENHTESKEARRERKRREGLEKQRMMKEQT